jgi:hypothetical protein
MESSVKAEFLTAQDKPPVARSACIASTAHGSARLRIDSPILPQYNPWRNLQQRLRSHVICPPAFAATWTFERLVSGQAERSRCVCRPADDVNG